MTTVAHRRWDALRKILRYTAIYGPGRTLFKAAGRLRIRPLSLRWRRTEPDIGLIGCGQYGFATIGWVLQRAFGARIAACHDIDDRAARSLAAALRVPKVCADVDSLLATPGLRTVYIASNHASHADYAVRALERGLDVYVEKPIAVEAAQFAGLVKAQRAAKGLLCAGYNRPFAAATRDLKALMPVRADEGITLQCFVSGHKLDADHWYRRPDEGTRICGNVGHWLDLMVHVLAWRGLPQHLDIALTWANDAEPDDNLHVAIRSDRHDLFGVTMTSRTEPFEGINESIHLQHGETIAHIDDYRRLTVRQGARLVRRRYWPKDVGHRLGVLQPFEAAGGVRRDWHEVELSTMLMLHIAGMVRARQRQSAFDLADASRQLAALT